VCAKPGLYFLSFATGFFFSDNMCDPLQFLDSHLEEQYKEQNLFVTLRGLQEQMFQTRKLSWV
jgi:hypothetical protein